MIYEALGFLDFFTCSSRSLCVGWAAQWEEMVLDPEQKIARPRQIYTGPKRRDYVPFDKR